MGQNKNLFRGFFYAPHTVAAALKTMHLAAYIFEKLGYSSAFQEGAQGEEKTAKLTDDEKKIYAALESAGKANINALAHVTGLPVWKLSGVIAAMEVKGVLMRTGGNFVSLV